MTNEEIRKIVEREGHGEHADRIDALAQPAVRIAATALAPRPVHFRQSEDDDGIDPEKLAAMEAALEALPLGASRFGGVPDLAPGQAWPEREGVPMEFIAQIDLAEVAALDPLRRLPASGSLLFFYNSQWDASDMEPGEACCSVLFQPEPADTLVRATPPRVVWKSQYADVSQIAPILHGLASLTFEATVSLPGGVSPFIEGPLAAFWQDFQAEHGRDLAGETEPYRSNHLLGYVDEQDYVEAHANGTADQLLLQVDSDGAADFQFGDCNKLFFLLTKAELAARDFSKVRVYSQLG